MMEMHTIGGSNGQTIEVPNDIFEGMKDVFLAEHWDSSGDFDGAHWCFEGRYEFHIWLYDQLTEAGVS